MFAPTTSSTAFPIGALPSILESTVAPLTADSSPPLVFPCAQAADCPVITGPTQPTPEHAPALEPLATTRVWGIDFARIDMQQTVKRAQQIITARDCRYFITANLNYLMLADRLPQLKQVNQAADALIADGNPIVYRSRLTSTPLPCRVAGADLIVELARLSAACGYRIFFLGAAPGVAQRAADKLRSQFPELPVAGCYSPPFRKLTESEHHELLDKIRRARADILLVAFGQPKGEQWIFENHRQLGVPLSIQLGASFDFLAGTAKRAPAFWQSIGSEWLYRSLCEPRRLAPRYLRNIAFLLSTLLRDFKLNVLQSARLKDIRFHSRRSTV